MPDRSTIIPASQVAQYRTVEQLRVLASPRLAPSYIVWDNGGGLVNLAAHVHPNAFVGVGAIVDEHAVIGKYVEIAGNAEVDGRCVGECIVDGKAVVEMGARVQDRVHVTGNALLLSGAFVGGHVCVGGNTVLGAGVKLGGGATYCLTDERFVLENVEYVLGSNIVVSKRSQIKALEAAMAQQVL
jgi:UDP-3-O-[3-hydroxymyristoyl] glucosamine N-acyltransferase